MVQKQPQEFTSTDPVTNEIIWRGNHATQEQVDQAIQSAKNTNESWSESKLDDRMEILNNFSKNLSKQKNELAELISRETGKPLWESLTEVTAMSNKVSLSIEAFQKRTSQTSQDMPDKISITRFRSHGVMAVFGPFNFPGHLPNGHIVPALLAGNTIVFKPSELTPAVAEKTMKLWEDSGIPEGVINLVQGGKTTGQAIIQNPHINGIFFTGSAQTGTIIHKAFAARPQIILALEMGGNNPLIVHEISDIKTAAYQTIQSSFITAGQRCTCARRLIVPQGKPGDLFIEQLVADIQKIQVGYYKDRPEPFMGSVITQDAAQVVLLAQDELIQAGGISLIKVESLKDKTPLLSPGLIDVTQIKNRQDKEIFGPLLQLIRVKDFEAALEEADNTAYGLAAGLMSDNKTLYEKFCNKIRAGIVNWNTPLTGASSRAPFGGIGLSGNHRPSAYFAADYCSYPVASLECNKLKMPDKKTPGLE